MTVYADQFPQEKAYVQFDKKIYNPGETIWFKAYLFTGFDPSPYSKSFYAEMFDASGALIERKTAPLSQSMAASFFEIPVKFKGSRVHIRAYTTWMLNFDSTFVFEKDLRIAGISRDSAGVVNNDENLHFFPEGGELVEGVENNIAFKADNAYGQPVKVSGVLHDASGKNLVEFSTTHNGMGKFILTPDKTDAFFATWKDSEGKEHRTDLPPVKPDGIVLRVMNSRQKVVFSVAHPPTSTSFPKIIVIAHMNQQLVYKAMVNLKDNFMSGGNIPVGQLPSGILTVTVFDVDYKALAERVVFVNNHSFSYEPEFAVVAKGLTRRGRTEIKITVPDSLKCNVSLAITDAEVDGRRPDEDNIISRLLLTGDIHGYVKDPYSYFRNSSDTLAQQLDLVMLTHGWRKFNWQQLAMGKKPTIKYPITNYLALNASVLGVDPSRIAGDENLNVIFQNKTTGSQMINLPMSSKGKFGVDGMVFYDTAKAYYQFSVNRALSSQAAVVFNTGLYPGIRRIKAPEMSLAPWSPEDSALVRKNIAVAMIQERIRSGQSKDPTMLAEVTVKGRTKSAAEKLAESHVSGMFSGGDATLFDLVNDPLSNAYLDIFSYLQGKVAGLQITNAGPTPSLQWRGGTPTLYLNEMQVDASQLKNTSVSDIALVKVFRPGAGNVFATSGSGAIAVYTRNGSERTPDPSVKGLDVARLLGYSPPRQYFAPNYLANPTDETEDARTTLYWNPYIGTAKEHGRMEYSFYNNDVTHVFRVIMEGFSESGKLIHLERIIQ